MKALLSIIGLTVAASPLASAASLEKLATVSMPEGSAEIIAHNAATDLLVSTRDGARPGSKNFGVQWMELAHPEVQGLIRLTGIMEGGLSSVASVASHPDRPLVAAALIPAEPLERRGKVALVDLETKSVVAAFTTGYHPDSVSFTQDGRLILVSCEGEFGSPRLQTPGSLTVVDWERDTAEDYPLPEAFLEAGLRSPHGVGLSDLEPEYVSELDGVAYVSLQENNGLARFDLSAREWLPVWNLGTWEITGDFSDRDGPWGKARRNLDNTVFGLPQPDTIAAFSVGGRPYVATANEGDNAGGVRVKHLGLAGPQLDPDYRRALKDIYGADPQHDAALGRLQISPIDGDLDGDGDLDRLTAFGTRSFSIWDGRSGERIFDSGAFLERQALDDPAMHNWDLARADQRDSRSDNRGPEPEALAFGMVFGRPHLAVATERQGSVYLFEVSDPARPQLVARVHEARQSALRSPESVCFVPAAESPWDTPLLLCAWEGSDAVTIYKIQPDP